MFKHWMVWALALFLVSPLALADGELRPVSHEDVWLMKRLAPPVVSPDGQHAVVSVSEPSYEEDGEQTNLWLITVDGSAPPRQLTSAKSGENGVDWRPDSAKIAFAARREDDEESQIYIMDMRGPGEARRITDLSTGASNPRWSPDGTTIAFESRVWPDARDDEANRERSQQEEERGINVSRYEGFPIRDWNRWRDEKQTRLFVQEARADREPTDLLVGTELASGPGYHGELRAVWTPDGDGLVFSATENLHEAAFSTTRRHLYWIAADGGEAERIVGSDDFSCTRPLFSPEGDWLYCSYLPINEWVYNLTEIARMAWRDGGIAGDPELLTEDFDRSVNEFDISPDGEQVFLTAMDHGRMRLYTLPADGGPVEVLNAESAGVYSGPAAIDGGLVAVWESSAIPAEVVSIDPATGQHQALSEFNAERIEGLDRQAFKSFWFTSSKGREIHNWLALPPDFDENKQYPLVLFIHGGPFTSSLDRDHVRWSPHLLAAPGYVVLLTDYTGSVGYGQEFSRNIQGDPLATPGEELVEAVDAVIDNFDFIDPDRLAATGASYGGHLVNWLLATTDRFSALVGHAGLISLEGQWSTSDAIYHREIMNAGLPWESDVWKEQSPSTYAENFSTPTMLTIGLRDYRVPPNETIAAWTYLQRMQVPSRLLVFHDADHWIMKGKEARYFWEEVHDWLAKYLKE